MKTCWPKIAVSISAFALFAGAASAETSIQLAQNSCFDAGQRYVMQNGGTLVAAQDATQNGARVCKIVVLIHPSNGGRPKREVVYLPK